MFVWLTPNWQRPIRVIWGWNRAGGWGMSWPDGCLCVKQGGMLVNKLQPQFRGKVRNLPSKIEICQWRLAGEKTKHAAHFAKLEAKRVKFMNSILTRRVMVINSGNLNGNFCWSSAGNSADQKWVRDDWVGGLLSTKHERCLPNFPFKGFLLILQFLKRKFEVYPAVSFLTLLRYYVSHEAHVFFPVSRQGVKVTRVWSRLRRLVLVSWVEPLRCQKRALHEVPDSSGNAISRKENIGDVYVLILTWSVYHGLPQKISSFKPTVVRDSHGYQLVCAKYLIGSAATKKLKCYEWPFTASVQWDVGKQVNPLKTSREMCTPVDEESLNNRLCSINSH